MTIDLVVANGWVVGPHGRRREGVAVDDGRIVELGPEGSLPRAHRTIDAAGGYVIPGLIDPHVHMGSEEDASIAEGLATNAPRETAGMLNGGVTTFGHFVGVLGRPLAAQIADTIDGLDRHAHVDSFLHAYVMGERGTDELEDAWNMGVTSFKHFYNTYRKRSHEDAGLTSLFAPVENDVLLDSMEWLARKGYPGLAMVHAEDIDIVTVFERRVAASGRSDLAAWSDSRPNIAEWSRVRQAIDLAEMTGCPLYVAHMSTKEACAFVADARRRGVRVRSEVGPQWLTHHKDMEATIGCWGKVNPPLRSTADAEALWKGFATGGVTCLGTDHGTGGRTTQTKEHGGGKHDNIWDARPGIRGGSEHLLPVLMTYGVHSGRLSMEDLVRVGSYETAVAFGLYPRKGSLTPGADADIVVVDPERRTTIGPDYYRGLCEVSIYEGIETRGRAVVTVARGQVRMLDGDIVVEPGGGRYLPRGSASQPVRPVDTEVMSR